MTKALYGAITANPMPEPRIENHELVQYLRGLAWIQAEGFFERPSPELKDAIDNARRALGETDEAKTK